MRANQESVIYLFPLLFAAVISACSNDNGEAVQLIDADISTLRQVTDEKVFEAYLKNGLLLPASSGVRNFVTEDGVAVATGVPEAFDTAVTSGDSNVPDGGNFSSTNTQEQNVDESDVIKYDGEFLYIATTPQYNFVEVASANVATPAGIRVMQRTAVATMTEVAWPKLDKTDSISSLYLHQDRLVTIGNGFGQFDLIPVLYDAWYWGQPQTILNVFDVSVPASIVQTNTIEIDGYLETSRRIDDTLYLVTHYTPYLPQLQTLPFEGGAGSATVKAAVEQAALNDLLPEIKINDVTQPLVEATSCYLPEDRVINDGYAGLVVIIAINLLQPENFTSVCFNAVSQGIYVSENAMYISASSLSGETAIHKFDLNNGSPKYSATGFIKGHLGWRNPAFRMSEFEGHLRVVSTIRKDFNDFDHQLYVLEDDRQGVMQQRSILPNESFPEKIGKPGEDITAVRYYGSRAYVVTFEQTDPLYVVNLKDPSAPFIQGSLEIPGFSSYLHPVNENLLLGMGWDNGVKLSLFDVSDLSKPKERSNFVWPDAYSPIQHDYRALAFLELAPGQYRFSFPVHSYNFLPETVVDSKDGLQLFDLTTDDIGTATLTKRGVIDVDENYSSYRDRSVIQNDEVLYIHGDHVWSAPWSLEFINSEQ